MAIRSRDDGTRILGPYLERVTRCFERAWGDLEREKPEIRAHMSARTRACFLNDRILLYAREEFENDRGVAFLRGKGGLFLLGIAGAFLLRFKKLKANLRSSNIYTNQSKLFTDQRVIEGLPDVTHVNAGYILNRMQTAIAMMYVTCPVGTAIKWEIDLAEFCASGNVAEMPTPTQQPKPRTKLVPKKTTATDASAPRTTVVPPKAEEENTPKRTQVTGEEDGGDDDRSG